MDAFTLNWKHLSFYAFPPFWVILRVSQKFVIDKATGIAIVPLWKSQSWYPLFIVGKNILLGPNDNLLFNDFSPENHPLSKNLILVAAKLSGKYSNEKDPRGGYEHNACSLSGSTLRQYTYKLWWKFCIDN